MFVRKRIFFVAQGDPSLDFSVKRVPIELVGRMRTGWGVRSVVYELKLETFIELPHFVPGVVFSSSMTSSPNQTRRVIPNWTTRVLWGMIVGSMFLFRSSWVPTVSAQNNREFVFSTISGCAR